MRRGFTRTSIVSAAADIVWEFVTTPEGINHELWPVFKMTVPKATGRLTIADVEAPIHLGRSWILLGTVLPIDYDDIGIAELDKGMRFKEESTMLSMREWGHERTVLPRGGECTVTDKVSFRTRIPGLSVLMLPFFKWYFGHRHRRLRAALRVKP